MAAQNWMHTSGFYRETGILPDHFHHVYHRSQKRRVCNRLGITHFVDDRWDVLRRLDCHRRYLYSEPGCAAPNGAHGVPTCDRRPSNLVIGGWREVLADLGLSLAPPRPSANPTFAMPPRPSASPTVVMLQRPKAHAPHAVDVSAVPLRKRRVGSDVVSASIGSAAPSTSGTATHATPTTDSHQCHLHGDDDDDDDMYRRRGDAAQPAAPKAPGMYRRGGSRRRGGSIHTEPRLQREQRRSWICMHRENLEMFCAICGDEATDSHLLSDHHRHQKWHQEHGGIEWTDPEGWLEDDRAWMGTPSPSRTPSPRRSRTRSPRLTPGTRSRTRSRARTRSPRAQPQDEFWPQWRTDAARALRESRRLGPVNRA